MFLFYGLTISIVIPMLLGYGLLRHPQFENHLNRYLILGLVLPIGWGIVSFVMLVCGLLSLKLDLLMINTCLILLMGAFFIFIKPSKRNRIIEEKENGVLSIISRFASFYTASQIFFVTLCNLLMPIYGWDAIWRIAMKAKSIYVQEGYWQVRNLPWAAYPLHLESLLAWVSMNCHGWNDYIPKIVTLLTYVTFVILFYGLTLLLTNKAWAKIGCALLVSASFCTYHGIVQYADLLLSFYNVAILALVMIWIKNTKNIFSLFLAGFLASVACWTKLEAIFYFFIFLISLGIVMKGQLKGFFLFCLPSLLFVILYMIFRETYQLNDSWTRIDISIGLLFFPHLLTTIAALGKNLFLTNNWNILWGVGVISSVLGWKNIQKDESIRLIFVVLIFFFLYLILAAGLTQRYDYIAGVHSFETLSRVLLHFYPLCPLLIILVSFNNADRLERILK